MKPSILITTLARYQTDFWIPVAQELERCGHHSSLLCFDDPSHLLAQRAGLDSYNAFALANSLEPPDVQSLEAATRHLIGCSLSLAISHERLAYGLRDGRLISEKLGRSLRAASAAIAAVQARKGKMVVIQELGGFASVIGTYLAARAANVDNLFIEPSFYRGRFFLTPNSFEAPQVPHDAVASEQDPEAIAYLKSLAKSRAIVIPLKDKHHYQRAWRKISNVKNALRLGEKLYEKYVLRQQHEFGYIGHHVASHLRMALNAACLRKTYTPLHSLRGFVYYPLHVPADVALTIRAPMYLDQLALVDYIARNLPASYMLAIKEHPAQIGALDARRLEGLLRRYDNVALLSPATNNYDVLERCKAVVSVNSKAGAEALLVGRPTLVLGDAFYARDELLTRVSRLAELPTALYEALTSPSIPSRISVEKFFSNVWRATYSGELYTTSRAGRVRFSQSLTQAGLSMPSPSLVAC